MAAGHKETRNDFAGDIAVIVSAPMPGKGANNKFSLHFSLSDLVIWTFFEAVGRGFNNYEVL